jgi:hypothetical protein
MTKLYEWAHLHDTSEDGNTRWSNDYNAPVYRSITTCHTPLHWTFGIDFEIDPGSAHYKPTKWAPRGDSPERRFLTISVGPFHLNYMSERRPR